MAFEPVALTDPKGVKDDVVAETAADLSNFLYRDGYVKVEDAVESEADAPVVGPDTVVTAETPKSNGSTGKTNTAKPNTGKAADATGTTVQTA